MPHFCGGLVASAPPWRTYPCGKPSPLHTAGDCVMSVQRREAYGWFGSSTTTSAGAIEVCSSPIPLRPIRANTK